MKKIFGLLTLTSIFVALSCSNKAPEAKKEVIVVPATPVIIVTEPPAPKSTTVTFDKNGVKVETKKKN